MQAVAVQAVAAPARTPCTLHLIQTAWASPITTGTQAAAVATGDAAAAAGGATGGAIGAATGVAVGSAAGGVVPIPVQGVNNLCGVLLRVSPRG